MIQTASFRAVAVETACMFCISTGTIINSLYTLKLDAAAEFCQQKVFYALHQIDQRLGNLDQHLGNMDNSLQNIDNNVKIGLAQTANLRIVSCNTCLQAPLQLQPLQKTVSSVQLFKSTL